MKVLLTTEELLYFFETALDEIKGKQKIPIEIIKQFKNKVTVLMNILTLTDLYKFGGLNFEKLKGELKDYYSIRLNQQYRLIFKLVKTENDKIIVEIIHITEISKHYE